MIHHCQSKYFLALKQLKIKHLKFSFFFLYFCLVYHEHHLLSFYLQSFGCFFFSCIQTYFEFKSSRKTCGILFSTSTNFVFRATFESRLVILGILFSIPVPFAFNMVVVTNPLTLCMLFFFKFFVVISPSNQHISIVFLKILYLFANTFIFFSKPRFSESYCVSVTNPIIPGTLVSIALNLITN